MEVQPVGGSSDSSGQLKLSEDKNLEPKKINENSLGMEMTAESGIVVDERSGKILWEKNSEQSRAIASLTKLMTALVFLDNNPGWDKEVEISSADWREGNVYIFKTGEKVKVRDLFYSMLIGSVNSSAAALARSTGLSESDFVAQMNEKAHDFGLVKTTFAEPTGLSSENQSTASEIAAILATALTNRDIKDATSRSEYTVKIATPEERTAHWHSTNWLIDSYLNKNPYTIIGGKTGSITDAGYCLATEVRKDKQNLIAVVLGSNSNETRFQDAKAIIAWAFKNYRWE